MELAQERGWQVEHGAGASRHSFTLSGQASILLTRLAPAISCGAGQVAQVSRTFCATR
jgi:hypothetical protein